MTQIVVLGPHYWGSSTAPGFAPGYIHDWALDVLTPLPGPAQQKLQSITVAAVPMWDTKVQSLGITRLNIVGIPSGGIAVNFSVENKHATSQCYGYKWWVSMVVP
jgi:hypothetical protein